MSVEGKVVVVTGASMGIGESVVVQLAAQGAKVVLAARSEDKLKEVAAKCGGDEKALVVVIDVTKRADHERTLQEAIKKFSHVDVWVNNAGRGITKSVVELTDEDFDEMMLVNTKSALYGMQVAFSHFRERKSGHIINVSSLLGRLPMPPFRAAYCAAKHALNSLTCSVRMEAAIMGLTDIHVSLVSPGIVATDFGLNAIGGGADTRTSPGAQPVEEVGEVIVDVIKRPRADEYTRKEYRGNVAGYYAAEDVVQIESKWVPIFAPQMPLGRS